MPASGALGRRASCLVLPSGLPISSSLTDVPPFFGSHFLWLPILEQARATVDVWVVPLCVEWSCCSVPQHRQGGGMGGMPRGSDAESWLGGPEVL